jgi:Cu+-exporting ATPase
VPRTARRETAGGLETVPVEALRPGDRIDLGPGDEIGADGEVCEGSGQVRMALVTGEAAPVMVGPGDRVVAGAVLLDGALSVRVDAAGKNTLVSRMAAELEAATDRPVEPSAADRIAPWFTAATLVIATATFSGWWLLRGLTPALTATVAVLVVACPCALALAQPLAAAAGLGASARRGLLLRSTEALLRLEGVTLVVFDKTGTLTGGALRVAAAESETLRVAAGLERYSNHPIARAIVDEAITRGIPLPRASQVQEIPGIGLSGELDGERWRLTGGGPGEIRLLDERGEARTILLADRVRPDAARTVAALKSEGLRVALLTGDHPETATRIGEGAGVDEIVARQDPLAKAAWITARRAEGHRIVFAGDGINDGPALAAADVGIAMGQGASSSLLVADGVIATESLGPLLAGRRAARAARRAIAINLQRSLVYNILAVSAAVAGLVNPLVAAVLMPLSSGLVIWGASRVEAGVRREET